MDNKFLVAIVMIAVLILGGLWYAFSRPANQTDPGASLGQSLPAGQTSVSSGMGGGAASTSSPLTNPFLGVPVTMSEQNASKENGTAILTESSGKTIVALNVQNEPAGASQPAHIHLGSCPAPGEVAFSLSNVINGKSLTVLDIPLRALLDRLPLSINIHKSAGEIQTYVSCGDILSSQFPR